MRFGYNSNKHRGRLGKTSHRVATPFYGIRYTVGDLDRNLNDKEVPYVQKPDHKFTDRLKYGRDVVKRRPTPNSNNDLTKNVNFEGIEDPSTESVSLQYSGEGMKMVADSPQAIQFMRDNKAYQLKLRLLRDGARPLKKPNKSFHHLDNKSKGGNKRLSDLEDATERLNQSSSEFKEMARRLRERNKNNKFSLVGLNSWLRKHILPMLTAQMKLPKMLASFVKNIKFKKVPSGGVSVKHMLHLSKQLTDAVVKHSMMMYKNQMSKHKNGGSLYLSGASNVLQQLKDKAHELHVNLAEKLFNALVKIMKQRHQQNTKGGSLRLAGQYGNMYGGKVKFSDFTKALGKILKPLGEVALKVAVPVATAIAPEFAVPVQTAVTLANSLIKK